MGMRPTHDPFGGHGPLVDKLIGNAYDIVKHVAMNMAYVKHVSFHLEHVFTVSKNIQDVNTVAGQIDKVVTLSELKTEIEAIYQNLASLLALAGKLEELMVLRQNLNALLSLESKTPELVELHTHLSKLLSVYASLDAINGIYQEMSKIRAIYDNLPTVVQVGENIVPLVAVGDAIEQVLAVEAKLPEIETVAAQIAEVAAVGTNIQAVLDIHASLNAVGGGSSSGGLKPYGYATIGDSITQAPDDWNIGWAKKVEFFTGGRARLRLNPSVGGYTMEQIRDLLLPQVLALNPKPRQCVISGGTYNLGSDMAYASGLLVLTEIINALVAAGIEPVLWTCPPQLSTDRRTRTANWNNQVWRIALQNGFRVIDSFSFFQDPATGLAKASLFMDDLHPNDLGYTTFGKSVADSGVIYEDQVPFPLASSNVYPGNLITNPLFLVESGTAGWAEGWTTSGAGFNGTASIVPDASGEFNWQRFSWASGIKPETNFEYILAIGSMIPDHVYQLTFRVRATKAAADHMFSAAMQGLVRDSSWASLLSVPLGQRIAAAEEDGVVMARFTAPAQTSFMTLFAAIPTTAGNTTGPLTLDYALPYMIDLTAAGLA